MSGTPALVVGSEPDASLTFGTHNGSGTIAPLLSVDSSGNVTAKGTLSGVQTAGSVRLVAGTAFDGTVLPLPAGVDQATIDSGGLELSILVTPHLPDLASAPNAGQMFLPTRCEVDADRRVACEGTWFTPGSAAADDEAAACDFLVLVSVPGGAP